MTGWLDPEEQRAWRGIVEVYADVMASLETELQEAHGLSLGDYGVLVNLSEAPDRRLRMCDLAERLHLSPSGLTRRLDGLVRAGLVERVGSPDDRRVTLASITARGMEILRAAAPDHVTGVRTHLLEHLSRTQIRHLGAAMAAVGRGRARRASEADHASGGR